MAERSVTGKTGEQLVVDFLVEQGWKILHQNWRWKRYELDLIALLGETLVFGEVKTRSRAYYDHPGPLVNQAQQRRLIAAAQAFMLEQNYQGAIRFDIFLVDLSRSSYPNIEHYPDAYFPGLG